MSVAEATAVDAVTVLLELLSVPSPTGDVEVAAGRLVAVASAAGFDVQRDAAGSVVMRWGARAAGPGVMLLGHLDTVPGDIPVRREGGRLHGRGAVDAKGPLAAAISAVSRLPRDDGPLTIVAVCDEEGPSRGAHHLLEGPAPTHLIVLEPSGCATITTGYRGCIRASVAVAQPCGHHAVPRPSASDRLLGHLRDIVSRVAQEAAGGRAVDGTQVRVNALRTLDDGLVDHAEADLEVRLPLGRPAREVLASLEAAAGDAELTIAYSCDAAGVSRSNPVVRSLARAIASTGIRPRYTSKTGTSDLNVVLPTWRCPAAVYGPGDSSLDHTPHEHIEVDELRRGADILATALQALR